ncbi:MAG: NAD-dependent epimerase/dehydratase family protein [Ignavibacteriales bacterium]|nr:NAD-dependent epimerase/dehydratase family protein [Ignavibacteriales bacterium]
MKKVFITGGEGFIGYHLTKRFLAEGYEVITYDIQTHSIPFDKSNWPQYIIYRTESIKDERLTRVRGDVCDRGRLKTTLERHKPDVIVHLAALSIAGVSNDYPEEAHRNVLNSTITLMDVLKELDYGYDRIVHTSSSMAYGNFLRDDEGNIIPAREDQMCDPIDIYGSMKLAGEYIVKSFNHRFKIPYVIIRPSAVYGPTDCNRRVTEIFLRNAMDGKPLKLDNGGLHQLDFTYVEDLAEGFFLAATKKEALGNTFNLTRGEGRTIKDLAEVLKGLMPETEIITREIEVYRPNRGQLDISKAKRILGFDPKHSLEEGMKSYYEFAKAFEEGKR